VSDGMCLSKSTPHTVNQRKSAYAKPSLTSRLIISNHLKTVSKLLGLKGDGGNIIGLLPVKIKQTDR